MKLKNRVIFFTSLMLIVLMLSGCTLFPVANGKVVGKVTKGDGETVVPGAEVFVGGKKVVTDNKGEFSINLLPGKYSIIAKAAGKDSDPVSFEIKKGETTQLTIKISGIAVGLSGTVKISGDKPLPGAKVSLGTTSAITGADGKYIMNVDPGEAEMVVEYKGYKYTAPFTVPEKDTAVKDFELAELAEISLTLKNNEGAAHDGLSATVEKALFKDTVNTNDVGMLSFIAPKGEADVTVNLPLLGTDHVYSFTKSATLGTTTDLVYDVADKCIFQDDFSNDLSKWVEGEAWDLNQWAHTTKGAKIVNGVLTRDFVAATSSGLKIKDLVVTDAIVIVKARSTEAREGATAGLRIQVRNNIGYWAQGLGSNSSTYGTEIANWVFYGLDKAPKATKFDAVSPDPNEPQFAEDGEWITIAVAVQDQTLRYFRNGTNLINTSATDPENQQTQGGIFIEFNGGIEIDEISVYGF